MARAGQIRIEYYRPSRGTIGLNIDRHQQYIASKGLTDSLTATILQLRHMASTVESPNQALLVFGFFMSA